jgi:hypothetical protein
MSQQISLKEAESRVFRLSQFQDGLWDILLGGEFVYLGFYNLFRERLGPVGNLMIFIGVILVLVTIYLAARKLYVSPRIGSVKFGMRQNKQKRKLWAATSLLVLLTSVVAILLTTGVITTPVWQSAPQWLNEFSVDIFFTVLIIGFFTVFAYVVGIARLHLYGWLIGLGNLGSNMLGFYRGHVMNWPFLVAGLTMIVVGAFMFARFLRDYPVPVEEA